MILLLIIGTLCIISGFLFLVFYLRIIKKGKRYSGHIYNIQANNPDYRYLITDNSIEVMFHKDGEDYIVKTLNSVVLGPFFTEKRLNALRKKYKGRPVYIYYREAKRTQVLIKEFMWKIWIVPYFLMIFGLILNVIAIIPT